MRVLLTNDDGIFAKGIETLYLALQNEHDVTVVAPETEQSAVGHAITMIDPLRVKAVNRNGTFFGYALNGTPADCVKLAITELLKPPPEIVVSGINMGANVGVNVIYSGTVSAATEGTLLGIPSIAVSLDAFESNNFEPAAAFILQLIQLVERFALPPGVLLNVNVPNINEEQIRGVRITRQGEAKFLDHYDRRVDPRNHVYYWLCGSIQSADPETDTDAFAIAGNYISVTPIHYDLTNYAMLEALKQWPLETDRVHRRGPQAVQGGRAR
jgi:5'-nucleotidase